MRIVFDLDDTIQFASFRDYVNAIPHTAIIKKMRDAKAAGAYIIINTARGMLSCGGDRDKADKKNRDIIENWLKKYDVPYDELVFGKPMADAYVDDKAIKVSELENGSVRKLNGYSGSDVWQIGSVVQKYAKDCDKVAFWYKQAKAISGGLFKVPDVLSYREGNIQIEYINGTPLYKCVNRNNIESICTTLRLFESMHVLDNSYDDYTCYVENKLGGIFASKFESLAKKYRKLVEPLFRKGTFCHGDFSIFNIIISGQIPNLIDPCVRRWNTWLLDAAKMRATLSGLGSILGSESDYLDILPFFDSHFTGEENVAIQFLELTQYIRVLPYAENEDYKRISELIEKKWF